MIEKIFKSQEKVSLLSLRSGYRDLTVIVDSGNQSGGVFWTWRTAMKEMEEIKV